MMSYVVIFMIQHVIRRISVSESVDIYLIHDTVLSPLRLLKPGDQTEVIVILLVPYYASPVKKSILFPAFDKEMPSHGRIIQLDLSFVEIKNPDRFYLIHQQSFTARTQKNMACIFPAGSESDTDDGIRFRFKGRYIILCNIRKQGLCLHGRLHRKHIKAFHLRLGKSRDPVIDLQYRSSCSSQQLYIG